MSILPLYQRVATADADDHDSYDSHKSLVNDEPAPSYPPMASSSETHSNVTYTFVPRWPIKGKPQDALGVLGGTKAVSLSPIL